MSLHGLRGQSNCFLLVASGFTFDFHVLGLYMLGLYMLGLSTSGAHMSGLHVLGL